MSITSEGTAVTPQRQSLISQYKSSHDDIPEVPTRIVEDDDQVADLTDEPVTKFSAAGLEARPAAQQTM